MNVYMLIFILSNVYFYSVQTDIYIFKCNHARASLVQFTAVMRPLLAYVYTYIHNKIKCTTHEHLAPSPHETHTHTLCRKN